MYWPCANVAPSISGGDDQAVVLRQTQEDYLYGLKNNPLHDSSEAGWDVYQSTRASANDTNAIRGPMEGPGVPKTEMLEYFITFGQQYDDLNHIHSRGGHRDGWCTIVAPNIELARTLAFSILGEEWCAIYSKNTFDSESYPKGELMRFTLTVTKDHGPDLSPLILPTK